MWLSLGKLLVNLLQVVKRTNSPLIPQQMASSTDHGFLGRGFKSYIHLQVQTFSDFPHVKHEKNSGNETAGMLKGPPVYPADLLSRRFRGGECSKA